jgi:hypothetical protein
MDVSKPRPHRQIAVPPVRLGSEFDLTFDMAGESSTSPSKSTHPFGTSALNSTQPISPRHHRIQTHDTGPITGANAPEVHHIGIVRPRNQAPVPMAKLSSQNVTERANTARSSVKTPRPTVKPKIYVFAYHEEAGYIPRPFISSHRPNVPRDKAVCAQTRGTGKIEIKFEKPAKLSKRREVVGPGFCHSIIVGSFQQFEEHHRGA